MTSSIERRLQAVEDRLAIIDLIARYGPAADSAEATTIASLWHPEGTYTVGEVTMVGDEVPTLVDWETHRGYLAAGCGHVLSTPRIDLDGDRATAVNHSIVLQHGDNGWDAVRVSANRWELERLDGAWRVRSRTAQLLDGSIAARGLLAGGALEA